MAKSATLEKIISALQSTRAPANISWELRRAGMEAMQQRLTIPDDVTCEPADANGVAVEWIRAAGASDDRIVFYLHGGGYTIGSITTHRFLMQAIGRASNATVLGVDYRLAPEDPFPAALDDSIVAWHWLLDQGVDPLQCVIAGDSAGGGLTLATLLRLRDENGKLPAAGVCLSPWTNLDDALRAQTRNNDPMVQSEGLRAMAQAYMGEQDPKDPFISPAFADPAGLPPLLIQVGTAEHLLQDSVDFDAKARAAGVDVTLEEWEDMIHVFQFFPALEEANQAIAKIGRFVQSRT